MELLNRVKSAVAGISMPWQAKQMVIACYAERKGNLRTLTMVARALGALGARGVEGMAQELTAMRLMLPEARQAWRQKNRDA